MLRCVHGEICVAQELVTCRRGPAVRNADAGADVELLSGNRERLGEHIEQLLGDYLGIVLIVDVLDQDRELVAAQPGGGVRGAKAPTESFRHGDEQLVACSVPEAVVHGLELVEVDEQHGHATRASFGAGERVVEAIREEGLVGEVGERVVERLVRQRDLQPDPLGDVAQAPDASDDLSVDPLGHVPTLERTAIAELDDVLAAALRVLGDVLGAADEDVRVLQLRQDEREHLLACQGHGDRVRQAEELPEPLVEVRDQPRRC